MNSLNTINWPELSKQYSDALKEGVEWIMDKFDPVGVIAAGTIIRGNPDKSSDFDIFVIHNAGFRQRIQKIFKTIPFEIFVNPPCSIIKNLQDEYKSQRQCTAHMLSTGHVLINKEPIVNELIVSASKYLETKPVFDINQATMLRYKAAVLLEDALDIKDKDIAMTNLFISDAVQALLGWFYYQERVFIPRQKELIVLTEKINPEIGDCARKIMESEHVDDKITNLIKLADLTIKTYGFFEWESKPEEVTTVTAGL